MRKEFDHISQARQFIVDRLSDDALLGRGGRLLREGKYLLPYKPAQEDEAEGLMEAIVKVDLPARNVRAHVVDLAQGHVKAIDYAAAHKGTEIFNLGTGNGYSVLDIVNTFSRVNELEIPYDIKPRRPGDIAECYADASKAARDLGWKAQYDLEDMCRDSWNWQRNNPQGY